MVEFQISAPGKITLFGEHAFLHGKDHLLAASINLRTTLKFTELSDLSDSQDVIKIEFSHIGLSVNIPLQQFLNHFCGDEREFAGSSNLLHSLTKKFVLLDSKKLSLTQQKNLNIFLYLLASVTYYEQIKIKSFHVHLSTLLPTDNEGLGTTMSSAVCLAACFLHWSCLQKNAAQDAKFDKNCLEKISKYAVNCENFIYDDFMYRNIRIESNVCTYGSIIEFCQKSMNVFSQIPSLKILLVDTRNRETVSSEKHRLNELRNKHFLITYSILDSMTVVSQSICKSLKDYEEKCKNNSKSDQQLLPWLFLKLRRHCIMGQKFVAILHVSNKLLSIITTILEKYGLAAKYTDGERGRYAYVLLPLNATDKFIKNVSKELLAQQFGVTMIDLCCDGVRIE